MPNDKHEMRESDDRDEEPEDMADDELDEELDDDRVGVGARHDDRESAKAPPAPSSDDDVIDQDADPSE